MHAAVGLQRHMQGAYDGDGIMLQPGPEGMQTTTYPCTMV